MKFHAFITSALDADETLGSGRFNPGNQLSVSVGQEAQLASEPVQTWRRREESTPFRESNQVIHPSVVALASKQFRLVYKNMNGTKMNLGISHLDISSGISVVMWSLVELVFYILRAISYSPQLCTEHSDLYFVPENYNAYLLFLQNFIQFRSIFVLVFHLIFNSHFIIYSYQLSVDPLSRNHWDLPCPCIQ